MTRRRFDPLVALLAAGILGFLLAGLSIVDMFVPRPHDGVVLESDTFGDLRVREVVPGSGAHRAGIQPGDRILGIGREVFLTPSAAARQLNRYEIGAHVPYLIETARGRREVEVVLGPRSAGDPSYLYACLLGFSFFGVGLFVLLRQPHLRASQVFFALCTLFMLFLICRLRPASYSRVDELILSAGTAALLFLPATFLHFFLIFPRPIWSRWWPGVPPLGARRWIAAALVMIYLDSPLVLAISLLHCRQAGTSLALISGAPAANWWTLAAYMVLGLSALATSAISLPDRRERRGAGLVFFGSLFGLVPFLVLAVAFPSFLHTEQFLFYGVVPLVLVPLTFAYAIVRFQLLDIRVILRKSLLYTLTTAVITGLYAVAIAAFGSLFKRAADLAHPDYLPIVLALAVVLLFEPLRRRLQVPVERFFFAERRRLENAAREMTEALSASTDLAAVVRDLVEELPRLLGLHFAALYLVRGEVLERAAGPESLPASLPVLPAGREEVLRRGSLVRLDALGSSTFGSREARRLLRQLKEAGVEMVGDLASPRRWIGAVMLSGKTGQLAFEPEELELLRGLLQQAAMALETSLLLEERTRQAELERELEIAAAIQSSLVPASVEFAPGWKVAAVCRPARQVGGDFIAHLPGQNGDHHALVYGDVSGKSVSGALVMMAAHEVLTALAMTQKDPEELLRLANQRLHQLGRKRFVAVSYFAPSASGCELAYVLAGQPQPLMRGRSGEVVPLPLPEYRLPLGALASARYRMIEVPVEPGELILGYSDGVVEAQSATGEFFGSERLVEVLRGSPPEPEEVVRRVLHRVDAFIQGNEPYDDLTLVALAREEELIA